MANVRLNVFRGDASGGEIKPYDVATDPGMSATWRKVNLICALNAAGDGVDVVQQPMPPMRPELLDLFKKDELKKYYTDEEIADVSEELPAEVPDEVAGEVAK